MLKQKKGIKLRTNIQLVNLNIIIRFYKISLLLQIFFIIIKQLKKKWVFKLKKNLENFLQRYKTR